MTLAQRNIAVLTDSACDMPYDLAEKSGVDILNFHITVDGKGYVEREDFDFDEYFDILRNCEKVPSTSQITAAHFLEKFKAYDDAGITQALYISICAAGSATHDAAVLAQKKFEEQRPESPLHITVVDSRCYSMAYGWYVAKAARQLANGAEMRDVAAWLEDIFNRVEIILAAYSLKFIKKSGRISAAAAFAGELLGLKPIISLVDGKSVVQKKVRGDREVLPSLLDYVQQHMDPEGPYFGDYAIGGTDSQTIEALAALCKKRLKHPPLITFKLGAAVATNTGPDAIAMVYLGKPRK